MTTIGTFIESLKSLTREQQQIMGDLERRIRRLEHRDGTGARLAKRLRCPRCSRRFALPLHLGRHLSTTHHRKRTARKLAKKAT